MKKNEYLEKIEKMQTILEDITNDDIIHIAYKDVSFNLLMKEDFNKKIKAFDYNSNQRLDECYNRCSSAKEYIYYKYQKHFERLTTNDNINILRYYGVCSYNHNFINLNYTILKDNKYIINVRITPSHDYITIYECEV